MATFYWKKSILLALLLGIGNISFAQEKPLVVKRVLYKQVDSIELHMEVVHPPFFNPSQVYPGAIYFFGGGWKSGGIHHLRPQAEYFARRGMVGFLVDYRVYSRHSTTPFEALADAKSAIRFIKAHAAGFCISADRLVGIGASAGGHLAAATCLVEGYNDPQDDVQVNTQLNALVLFNPVLDNGPAGYGYDRVGKHYKSFSPLHNIRPGAPPTLLLLGTKDRLIPVETMQYYQTAMRKVGNHCELVLYEEQEHGFFNFKNQAFYHQTLLAADQFLMEQGYLAPKH